MQFETTTTEAATEFSAEEVSASFSRQGVVVEEAVEKHFEMSHAGDDDWSMV